MKANITESRKLLIKKESRQPGSQNHVRYIESSKVIHEFILQHEHYIMIGHKNKTKVEYKRIKISDLTISCSLCKYSFSSSESNSRYLNSISSCFMRCRINLLCLLVFVLISLASSNTWYGNNLNLIHCSFF